MNPTQPFEPASLPPLPPLPREYRAAAGTTMQAVGFLVLGGIFLALVIFRFVLLMLQATRPGPGGGPAPDDNPGLDSGLIGGMSAGAALFLISGIALLRRPVRARVADDGLTVEGHISRRFIPWERIARLQRDKKQQLYAGESHFLKLLDERGKELARVTDTFWGYPQLAADIKNFSSAARGSATLDLHSEQQLKIDRQRRSAWKWMILCVIGLLIGVAMLVGGAYESYWNHRLESEGMLVDAHIDKLYMRSVTGWIDVSYNDGSGARHTRSATLEPDAWRALQGRATVPMRYVPAKPDWSLMSGEHDTRLAGLLFGMGGVFVALCGAYLAMRAMGYVALTSRGGKTRFVRMGEVESNATEVASPRQSFATVPTVPPMVPYPTPYLEAPRAPGAVPSGIKTIAILNIVFGALGLLFNAARVIFFAIFAGRELRIGPNPVLITADPVEVTAFSVNALLALQLIISGVGLLGLRRWSRRMALVVAALQVAESIAFVVFELLAITRESAGAADAVREQLRIQISGLFCGQVVAIVYPMIVLIVLGRRSVADVFTPSHVSASKPEADPLASHA